MLCALMYRQNGDLANLLKSAREKSAPECPFECGGGVQSLFGQCPNRVRANLTGASLNVFVFLLVSQVMSPHQALRVYFVGPGSKWKCWAE